MSDFNYAILAVLASHTNTPLEYCAQVIEVMVIVSGRHLLRINEIIDRALRCCEEH